MKCDICGEQVEEYDVVEHSQFGMCVMCKKCQLQNEYEE